MRSIRRLIGVAALAAAPVAGLSLYAAPAAVAHDQLVASTPEDGDTVSTPLTAIELVYSNSISAEFTQVAVTGADGTEYQDGDPDVVGDTVTQAVRQLPDGAYTIAWRVVSSDGHPIDGVIEFTVTGAGPADPASTPAETPSEPPSASASTPAEQPSDDATPAAGSSSSDDDGGLGSTATVLLIAGGALVVAVLAFVAAGGRRRGAPEDTDS
ncbi:copper resistance CopC family protein [Jiangella muralis]|uniref:copper resistance CopC family protein n=1 Tax=Jiangella muralis TaxID=702383 RepID=UPI00069CD467|nr:copper resistance CopC family protein [Jiangella muralis]